MSAVLSEEEDVLISDAHNTQSEYKVESEEGILDLDNRWRLAIAGADILFMCDEDLSSDLKGLAACYAQANSCKVVVLDRSEAGDFLEGVDIQLSSKETKDGYIGTLMAALCEGKNSEESLDFAQKVSSQV